MKLKQIMSTVGIGIIILFTTLYFLPNEKSQIQETKKFGSVNNSITFFSATTTNATSTTANINAYIQGAKRATFYFQRGDTTGQGNSGSTSFSVEVSRTNSTSDADWIDYNKLIDNVTNANSQNLTRVGSASLSGTSTKIYSMDLEHDNINFVRCIAVETTDGEHTCRLETEF